MNFFLSFKLFDLVILFIGTLAIIWFFFNQTSQERFENNEFKNLGLMQDVYRQNREKVLVYKIISFASVFILLFSVINYRYDFFRAWVIIGLIGLVIAISGFLLGDIQKRKLQNLVYDHPSDTGYLKQLHITSLSTNKFFFITILATTLICANLAFQNIKNEKEDQILATSYMLSLIGNGWCGDFSDIDVYDGGETVVKKGGWPCIYIGSVGNISYLSENKKIQVCINVSFNEEQGPPGANAFSIDQYFKTFCQFKDDYGWSTDAMEEQIYQFIRPELDPLTARLCSSYSYQMSYEDYATYCN